MKVVLLIGISVLAFSCTSQKTVNNSTVTVQNDTLVALNHIDSLNSALKIAYSSKEMSEVPTKLIEETIQAYKDFLFKYPKHQLTPEAYDKIHQLYGQLGSYQLAAEYGEALLNKYPDYKKKNIIKYSLATSYDFFLDQKEKAIYLYENLLADKTISDNARNEIKERLNQLKK
jgi:tetratricopeptide (TPR) repeat protein